MTEFSTARVLTTEWIEGAKVADLPRLEAEHIDRRKAAQICVEAYCQQIFVDGLYHADPHPGNLLLQPPAVAGDTPTIVFLDFGATATVSEGMRRGMVSFLQGAITRDTTRIVSAMKQMGFISRRADPGGLRSRRAVLPRQDAVADLDRGLVAQGLSLRPRGEPGQPARPARAQRQPRRPARRVSHPQGVDPARAHAAAAARASARRSTRR